MIQDFRQAIRALLAHPGFAAMVTARDGDGQGARLALAGLSCGLVCAFAATRLLRSQLYAVTPWDPITFLAVGACVFGIALLSCYPPARRATIVDPTAALRQE